MRRQCYKVKESKVKESKGKEIGYTNVSMSDAEHPTQERVDYKALIDFFNEETQDVLSYCRNDRLFFQLIPPKTSE